MRTDTDPVSEMLCYLVFWNTGRYTKSRNPVTWVSYIIARTLQIYKFAVKGILGKYFFKSKMKRNEFFKTNFQQIIIF
jgi:hypothetical protein